MVIYYNVTGYDKTKKAIHTLVRNKKLIAEQNHVHNQYKFDIKLLLNKINKTYRLQIVI